MSRMISLSAFAVALSLFCGSCSKPQTPVPDDPGFDEWEDGGEQGGDGQSFEDRIRETKTINPFDEEGLHNYKLNGLYYAVSSASADKRRGAGGLVLQYSFTGKADEVASFEEETAYDDWRTDLSFHPLGLSIWVKGDRTNKETFRFILMEDPQMYSESKPKDTSRQRWQEYAFEDAKILSKPGWHRLFMPYDQFKLSKKGAGATHSKPMLNRYAGYRIEIVNTGKQTCTDKRLHFDELEQLTDFEIKKNKAKFSSMFIQLAAPAYQNTDWAAEFRASKAIGIDTWFVQMAGHDGDDGAYSFYKNSKMSQWDYNLDYIDKMFVAAEKEGMKLILGLYPGKFTFYNSATSMCYSKLKKQNKECFDELNAQFGNNPCLAGWYISEEAHDGRGPWQQMSGLKGLAQYYQDVAAYIKTKSYKPVCIAPALWRGMPADKTGKWFENFFWIAKDIDFLYLQDCGGRMKKSFPLTCPSVDLPNWYAEIKKACDKTGVKFGVDLESFWESTYGPKEGWHELEDQLQVAGMFTEYITNFSWVTFKKGTASYGGYLQYLQNNKIL